MKFVIGDIHGEIKKLILLINVLKKFRIDELIFIGDYIDKGQNSREVLTFLGKLSYKYKCTFLIGNHEFYWLKYLKENDLKALEKLKRYGAITTVRDFGINSFDRKSLYFSLYLKNINFFDKLKLFYEDERYIVVHSGVSPNRITFSIDEKNTESYLTQRYNFLSMKSLYFNKKIVFGHTGFIYPYFDGYKVGIDTSAVYGYHLTSFCISNDFFINEAGEIISLDDIDLNMCPIIMRNLPERLKNEKNFNSCSPSG